jgi:hypothetical protein
MLMGGSDFQKADFISIGTNDLTQLILAADRNEVGLVDYYSVLHPSVLRAVRRRGLHLRRGRRQLQTDTALYRHGYTAFQHESEIGSPGPPGDMRHQFGRSGKTKPDGPVTGFSGNCAADN